MIPTGYTTVPVNGNVASVSSAPFAMMNSTAVYQPTGTAASSGFGAASSTYAGPAYTGAANSLNAGMALAGAAAGLAALLI